MNYPTHQTRLKPAGFAMLEVLIAILVVSFGLLGLAGLQAVGLRNNHSAYMRSISTQQAGDIADRMRANLAGVALGSYHTTTTAIPTPDPGCITVTCSPADMAKHDLIEWKTSLASLLPGGVGVVCRDGTPNDSDATPSNPKCDGSTATSVYAIKIWWNDEKNPGATPNLKRFVTVF